MIPTDALACVAPERMPALIDMLCIAIQAQAPSDRDAIVSALERGESLTHAVVDDDGEPRLEFTVNGLAFCSFPLAALCAATGATAH